MKNDLIIEVSFITLLSSSNHSEDLETVVEISTLGSKQVEQHIGYFYRKSEDWREHVKHC